MDKTKNLKRTLTNYSVKTDLAAIVIQYTKNKDIRRYNTGVKINPLKWNTENAKPNHKALNTSDLNIVDGLYSRIATIISKYQTEYNSLPPIEYIDSILDGTKPQINTTDIYGLIDTYLNECEQRKTAKKLAPSTVTYYGYAFQHLKATAKKYKYKLNTDNFNNDFITLFKTYSDTNGNSNSTINKNIAAFVAFVKWLTKKGVPHTINTQNWDRANTETMDLLCLERNELKEILEYVPQTNTEQKTKDIIVFLAFTGVRVIDMGNIKKQHVQGGYITFLPQKTKTIKAKIPVSEVVQQIFDRYEYNLPAYDKSVLSTRIQNFCSNIKSLQHTIFYKGKEVPKYSVLTSHSVGRKSMINLAIQQRVPIPTIMGWSGHLKLDTVIQAYVHKYTDSQDEYDKVFTF